MCHITKTPAGRFGTTKPLSYTPCLFEVPACDNIIAVYRWSIDFKTLLTELMCNKRRMHAQATNNLHKQPQLESSVAADSCFA